MKENVMKIERTRLEVKEQTWASVVGTNTGKTYLGETTKDGEVREERKSVRDRKCRG
jgi:hypothetical protein